MRYTLFFALAAVIGFGSCRKNDKECSGKLPAVVFVNYSPEQSDTLIFRRFNGNNQFSSLIDTILFVKNKITRTVVGQDSTILTTPYPAFYETMSAYNWEVVVPGAGTITRISDFVYSRETESEKSAGCHSFVKSMRVNDRVYNFSNWADNNYRIFITR